ncbi:MAG: AlpA family phage regulatory protein [Motiliproteus sp.]
MIKADHTPPVLPVTGFLRLPHVLQFVPIGKSSWWAGVKSGKYPQSYKIGPRTTVWRCEDIRQLLEELSAGGEA